MLLSSDGKELRRQGTEQLSTLFLIVETRGELGGGRSEGVATRSPSDYVSARLCTTLYVNRRILNSICCETGWMWSVEGGPMFYLDLSKNTTIVENFEVCCLKRAS